MFVSTLQSIFSGGQGGEGYKQKTKSSNWSRDNERALLTGLLPAQTHLPRDGITHNGCLLCQLAPRKMPPQTCLQANLIEVILRGRFSPLRCVNLITEIMTITSLNYHNCLHNFWVIGIIRGRTMVLYNYSAPVCKTFSVCSRGGVGLKSAPDPKGWLAYSDLIQTTTWCLSGSLSYLLLSYKNKTNRKRTFWKSFLRENRLHSRFPFELFTNYILASGEPLYLWV